MKPLGESNRVHLSEQQKLLFLQSILSHKEILFGRHDLKKGIVNVTKPYKLVEKYDNINDLTMFVSKICD